MKPYRKIGIRRQSRRAQLNELALEAAERHNCKAAALMAGVDKILTDFVGNSSWGTDITIEVALALLSEAKEERAAGIKEYHRATQRGRR